jgi:hypothetical protein
MARRAKGSGASKSQAIRDYVAANPDQGPKAVAEALNAAGVNVTAAFVSTVKSTDKRKTGKKRGRPGRKPGGGDTVSMELLLKAKRLADQLGGIAAAKRAIDAYAKLVD